MKLDYRKEPIEVRFEHLLKLLSSERFLKRQGLNNEVPFFICPYAPSEAVQMIGIQKQLLNRLNQQGIRVLEINLYDLSIELLKQRELLDRIIQIEETSTKDQLKELLQNVLDPQTHLIPAIANKLNQSEVEIVFISGVGEVFPYIRSHNVLNNLQSTIKQHPMVMFFPGEYSHSLEFGATLNLFGRLQDDKYYRAFNIYNCEI